MTEQTENQPEKEEPNVIEEKSSKKNRKQKKQQSSEQEEQPSSEAESDGQSPELLSTIVPVEGSVKALDVSELSNEQIEAISNAKVPDVESATEDKTLKADEEVMKNVSVKADKDPETYNQMIARKRGQSEAMADQVYYRRTGRKPPNKPSK